MKIDRKKNTYRNIVWGILQQILAVILPFVIRTSIIRVLGAEYLGISNLFSSILQVLSLAEAGFSSAIVFSMYRPIAEENDEKIRALLSYYRSVYRMVGVIIFVSGLIVALFLDKLITGGLPSNVNIYILYFIFLFNTVISYFLFSYKSCLLTAHQRNDLYSKIVMFVMLGQNLLQILFLLLLKSYYFYIIWMPIATIITNLSCELVTKKLYPQYYCAGAIDKKDRKDIRKKIYGLVISKINSTTKNSFDSIFVSIYLGLTAIAVYGNYYYIMIAVHKFLAVFATSASAGIGNSVVIESSEKNYKDYRKLDFLYNWLSSWATVCLFTLYQPFMRLWVGEDLLASWSVMIIFCIYFYVICLGDVQGIYSMANGLWWENRLFYVPEAIANILLNWVLAKNFGVFGIMLASAITSLFIGNFGNLWILFKCYFKRNEMVDVWKQRVYYIFVLIICCIVTYHTSQIFQTDNKWLDLFVKAVICGILPNVIFCMAFRNIDYYKVSIGLFRQTINRIIEQ